MLRLFLPVGCLCILISGVAQNIEREDVKFTYVLLPLEKLPDTTETYFIKVKQSATRNGNTFLAEDEAEKISFNSYYRLPGQDDADVLADVQLEKELVLNKVELIEGEHTYKKNKNSPEIKYITYTYYIVYTSPKIHYWIHTGNGATLKNETIGGEEVHQHFGSTDYDSYYSSEYQLKSAWARARENHLNYWEKEEYDKIFPGVSRACNKFCPLYATDNYKVRYVKEKKTNDYEDLRQARDLMLEGAAYISSDRIAMINKVVQPDYSKRVDTIKRAIAIWEKALLESDLKNKKARIDSRVTRHIYMNLALAHALINDFDKAQQYLQGREDEETKKVLMKNVFSGMGDLSSFIDNQKLRTQANSWRPFLATLETDYVYKDPATRLREKQEAEMAKSKARQDSLQLAKKGAMKLKGGKKGKIPVKKGAAIAKKKA